ncbi:MAG TPA: hypothetical protein PLN27_15785 [Acidobacteriota bacterium]|nr:hypothetical protein [Acidobacteriota bacterium]
MDISPDIQELRVPLAVNLKTTIIFRIAQGPDGWRSNYYAQGPAFLWDQSISLESRAYGTSTEALRAEAASLIQSLKKTIKQSRVRERVITQLQNFLDALPSESPAPAAVAENHDQTDTPQPSFPVVSGPSHTSKKTPNKSTPKAPKVSTQVSSEPPPKPRRRRRTSLLKKTSISASTKIRPRRLGRLV